YRGRAGARGTVGPLGSQGTARLTQAGPKVGGPASPHPARTERPTREEAVDGTNERRGWRDWGGKAALALGGLLVGGVLVGTLTASAADTNAGSQTRAYGVTPNGPCGGPGGPRHGGNGDESRSQRPDEKLLTGDTASKVPAAA